MTASRIVLLSAALLLPAAPGTAQDAEDGVAAVVTLDVMTFNIRTAGGRDGSDAWEYRKELVAETIGGANPHILGLQEALTEQIDFLEEALPQYRWFGVDRGLNGGQGLSEATPIFYRYEELAPIEAGTFWLGNPPDGRPTRRGRGSRIVTWARFHHVQTGRQVYVFNTHLTLREGPRQHEGVAIINERIAALPPGSAVVVLGDFNALAGSSGTWDLATSQGLRDSWHIARARQGPAVTSNGFGPPPEDWEGRIDWILVGGPIAVPSVATIVHSVEGRFPSDHYPVFATLEIHPS